MTDRETLLEIRADLRALRALIAGTPDLGAALEKNPSTLNVVTVHVENGAVHDVVIPAHLAGLTIRVEDDFVDETKEDEIQQDESGREYVVCTWP